MNKKAQTSIEFMLIVLFIVVFIASTIMPMVTIANNSATEVSRLGNAKIAAQRIANAIDSTSASAANAKQTINVFVPEKTVVACDSANKKIVFTTEMDNSLNPKPCGTETTNCCQGTLIPGIIECTGEVSLSSAMSDLALSCFLDAGAGRINGKAMKSVSVEKDSAASSISLSYG